MARHATWIHAGSGYLTTCKLYCGLGSDNWCGRPLAVPRRYTLLRRRRRQCGTHAVSGGLFPSVFSRVFYASRPSAPVRSPPPTGAPSSRRSSYGVVRVPKDLVSNRSSGSARVIAVARRKSDRVFRCDGYRRLPVRRWSGDKCQLFCTSSLCVAYTRR